MYGFDGPKVGGFHHFDFADADSIFKNFFRSAGFDNDDDDEFFGSFFGNRGKKGKKGSGFGGMGSMFDDDFFKGGMGGMGGMGGFSSFSSSSFGGGGHGGVSKSVSTVTKTVNGKTVTTKKTTVVNPDGTKDVT